MERWVVVGGSGFSPFGFIGLCRKSKKESSKLLFWLITVERERERGERREERGRDGDGDEEDKEL